MLSENLMPSNLLVQNTEPRKCRSHRKSRLAAAMLSAVVAVSVASGAAALTTAADDAAAKSGKIVVDDPAKVTDPDFAVQGEYAGQLIIDGAMLKHGAQVIALGDGQFRITGYPGGLPGDGWTGSSVRHIDGRRSGDRVRFADSEVEVEVGDDELNVKTLDGRFLGELRKTIRKSPTLEMAPPAGAVVLLGKDVNDFDGKPLTADGLLPEGATSRTKHGSGTLHIEFRTPYQPSDRGQGRGNSGLYIQGRYEIQVLDSFGLEGKDNECGGLYSIRPPKMNMCFPPLSWQTYDVDFLAATFDDKGNKTAPAKMTIRHNGEVIHQDVELPSASGGSLSGENAEPGPIFLQDHGNPVRFRNCWFLSETEQAKSKAAGNKPEANAAASTADE